MEGKETITVIERWKTSSMIKKIMKELVSVDILCRLYIRLASITFSGFCPKLVSKCATSSADDAPRVSDVKQGSEGNAEPARPSGRVVGVIKQNWHSYCGSMEPMPMPAGNAGIAHALFVSNDRRFPKIRIQTRQLGNLLDKRISLSLDD